jgi:pimeloyl-ACP methyl ester carboxylesterase
LKLGDTTLQADLLSSVAENRALAVLVHGTLAHKDMAIIETLQLALDEAGYDSLAVNLSLGVDSRSGPYSCDIPHQHRQEETPIELELWLEWLAENGYDSVSLIGHSLGATQVAAYVANNSSEIRHVTLIAPSLNSRVAHPQFRELVDSDRHWFDGIQFLHCNDARVSRPTFLSYYSESATDDLVSYLDRIDIPVLVAMGSNDTVVPELATAITAVRNPNVLTTEIDGADHFFHDLFAYDVVDAAAEDFNRRPAIEPVVSLAKLSAKSRQDGVPIVLFVTEPGCPYCHTLKLQVLYPMIRAGELRDGVLFREMSTDETFEFRDFSANVSNGARFAKVNNILATPTLLFIGPGGEEVVERLVGISNLELYEFYLKSAIESAKREIRAGPARGAGPDEIKNRS